MISKEVEPRFSHTQKVGSSALEFLSSKKYDQLIVEIDYVTGTKPSNATLDSLKVFLEDIFDKPNGISISIDDEIPSPKKKYFKAEQIKKLEKKYRDTRASGSTLSAYILVLDGKLKKADLDGIAYLNTSIALFGEVIRDNYGKLGQPSISTAESAILMHEFGHLLGLVGKGIPMKEDHLEKGNGAHCSAKECLMSSTIQTSDGKWNLTGGIIPKLDPQCVADLRAITAM